MRSAYNHCIRPAKATRLRGVSTRSWIDKAALSVACHSSHLAKASSAATARKLRARGTTGLRTARRGLRLTELTSLLRRSAPTLSLPVFQICARVQHCLADPREGRPLTL